jgi:O-antigen/teichoic acid export membrane protein
MEDQEEVSYYSKEMAKGSIWAITGQVFFKFISFFYFVLIARAASQEDVGLFLITFGIMSFVAIFSHLGFPASLTRYVPYFEGLKQKGKIRDMLRLSYVLLTVFGLLFTFVIWLAADWIGEVYEKPMLPDAIRMFSVFLLLNNIFSVNVYYLQGRADIKSMQLVQNVQNFFKLVLTAVFFLAFGASLYTLIGGFLTSYLLALIVSLPIVHMKIRDLPKKDGGISKRQLWEEMLPFGLMLTIVSSLWLIIQVSDKLLLAYLVEPAKAAEIVAIYALATTAAAVLIMFPVSIGSIFLPILSRLAGKEDYKQMRSVTEAAQRWVLFVTIPTAIVLGTFSGDILNAFYGPAYATGALAMSIFVLGILVKSFSMMYSFALAALRLVKVELTIAFLTALANILLNILLIPMYGMEGAALASVISLFLMLALSLYYSKKLFDFRFHPCVYKMAFAGLVAFLIVLALQPALSSFLPSLSVSGGGELHAYASKVLYLVYVMLLTGIAVFLFMALSLLFKCFMKEDIILMKKTMRKVRSPASLIKLAERIASFGLAD